MKLNIIVLNMKLLTNIENKHRKYILYNCSNNKYLANILLELDYFDIKIFKNNEIKKIYEINNDLLLKKKIYIAKFSSEINNYYDKEDCINLIKNNLNILENNIEKINNLIFKIKYLDNKFYKFLDNESFNFKKEKKYEYIEIYSN